MGVCAKILLQPVGVHQVSLVKGLFVDECWLIKMLRSSGCLLCKMGRRIMSYGPVDIVIASILFNYYCMVI